MPDVHADGDLGLPPIVAEVSLPDEYPQQKSGVEVGNVGHTDRPLRQSESTEHGGVVPPALCAWLFPGKCPVVA